MFIETQSTGQEAVAGTSGEETNEDEVPKPRRYISWRTCTVHVWLWKFPAEKFKIAWSFYVHADVLSLPDFSAKSLHNVFPLNPTAALPYDPQNNLILHWPPHLLLFRVHHFYHIIILHVSLLGSACVTPLFSHLSFQSFPAVLS